jgi:predicted AlkP superfamily pyrophosphatase or phosphodiesterase
VIATTAQPAGERPPRRRALTLILLGITSARCTPPSQTEPAKPPRAVPAGPSSAQRREPSPANAHKPKVIVLVWDGLRPDSVSAEHTPNLTTLRDRAGVDFRDQHAVYPTFTMMNAAAFATGAYPARHGFYGNTEYQPGASGRTADGKAIDFTQPVFTEDHGVLQALDAFYPNGLFSGDTLFHAAHAAGLRTAAIGKIGPAFMQDFRPDTERSVLLDENIALPFSFAQGLQTAGFALPVNSVHYPFAAGQTLLLAPNNGKPTAATSERLLKLEDGVTPEPRSALGSPHDAANEYLMSVYLGYVLPKFEPDLSFVWLRNPDSTEHQFGPGSPNYLDALHDQDALLGKLQAKLAELGLSDSTDLLVVSDHGHSTVAGSSELFPLRALTGEPDGHGEVGPVDPSGYSVSGEIRSADLLTRAGFRHVYDGGGCLLDPVLSGIRENGALVYPTRSDAAGACTPKSSPPATTGPGAKVKPPPVAYSMRAFRVPVPTPKDAIVIATNGGSEYFYVLNQSAVSVRALVLALQERTAFGSIFVRGVYGAIPGTLPLSVIAAEGAQSSPPLPDLIVSFDWDDAAVIGGADRVPGSEYASVQRYRGIHGSFSPRDVHNTLIAAGPHFKAGFVDLLPTGNVDLAPTIAQILGLRFTAPDGRVLGEALAGPAVSDYHVEVIERNSDSVRLPKTCAPNDPSCARPGGPALYRSSLRTKVLTLPGEPKQHTYFDQAKVTRSKP